MNVAFLIHNGAPFSHRNVYSVIKETLEQHITITPLTFEEYQSNDTVFDWVIVFDHYRIRYGYHTIRLKSKLALIILEDTYEIDATKNVRADIVFTNDEGAIEKRTECGQNVILLPLACRRDVFFPEENVTYQHEVVVVGNAFGNRIDIIAQLSDFFKEQKMHVDIYGINWQKLKLNNSYIQIINGILSESQLADIYRSSKIALEINRGHHNQNVDGILPKTPGRGFSSLGCNCYTVTDKRISSTQYFPENCIGYFSNLDELKRLLLLPDSEKRKIAHDGCLHVHKHHTWEHRADIILQVLI